MDPEKREVNTARYRQKDGTVEGVDIDEDAKGVLFGGSSGGITLYLNQRHLVYEYNTLLMYTYHAKSDQPLPTGQNRIEVITWIPKPGFPGEVSLKVNGEPVARIAMKHTVPAAFSASETFDVGTDLGSPVSQNTSREHRLSLVVVLFNQ